jgi:hypothetical protein
LRRKAEDKLKAINEAYVTIRASQPRQDQDDAPHWRVRWRGREMRAHNLHAIATLIDRGALGEEAEVFDPGAGRWLALTEIPECAPPWCGGACAAIAHMHSPARSSRSSSFSAAQRRAGS